MNNDICYPSILVTGQIMEAIESGRYDLSKTAVVISQTGGGCRATNYIALIRKALRDWAPRHPGDQPFRGEGWTRATLVSSSRRPCCSRLPFTACCYGDLMMVMFVPLRPYEAEPGAANELFEDYMERARRLNRVHAQELHQDCLVRLSRRSTPCLAVGEGSKPRVGVVGEIL